MSVGWTCPSKRDEDIYMREEGIKPGPCPGHVPNKKGTNFCRVQGDPRSLETARRELARINNKENAS